MIERDDLKDLTDKEISLLVEYIRDELKRRDKRRDNIREWLESHGYYNIEEPWRQAGRAE